MMQGVTFEKKGTGFVISAPGFSIEVHAEGTNVFVQYSGNVPNKLKRLLEKYKPLFFNPAVAKSLICSELYRL